ncbi:MAG: hypothetical protein JXB03_10475 [Spirochaetales bacterium]|nr:hypothetical protein [Spirochaetales bacterium]
MSDLILVNMIDEVAPADKLLSLLSARMCTRRSGIGAQGAVFLLPGAARPVSVRYFLPDGSESILCAEPLMAASRYLFDAGIMGREGFAVETSAGEKTIRTIDSSNFVVSLGVPLDVAGTEISGTASSSFEDYDVVHYGESEGKVPLTLIDLGLNGAAFFSDAPLPGMKSHARKLAATLDVRDPDMWHPIGVFPYKIDEIQVRGFDRTTAAQPVTSAAIAAVASMIQGFSERSCMAVVRGSKYFIQWDERSSVVNVCGCAEYVFTGEYFFDTDRQG